MTGIEFVKAMHQASDELGGMLLELARWRKVGEALRRMGERDPDLAKRLDDELALMTSERAAPSAPPKRPRARRRS